VIDENALEQIFNAEFDNYSQAISAYNALENVTRSEPKINTLLISTSDMGQLS
jgi:hypothetical protein